MGIEPTALAWEARVLPLYDAREGCHSMALALISQPPRLFVLRRLDIAVFGGLVLGNESLQRGFNFIFGWPAFWP